MKGISLWTEIPQMTWNSRQSQELLDFQPPFCGACARCQRSLGPSPSPKPPPAPLPLLSLRQSAKVPIDLAHNSGRGYPFNRSSCSASLQDPRDGCSTGFSSSPWGTPRAPESLIAAKRPRTNSACPPSAHGHPPSLERPPATARCEPLAWPTPVRWIPPSERILCPTALSRVILPPKSTPKTAHGRSGALGERAGVAGD